MRRESNVLKWGRRIFDERYECRMTVAEYNYIVEQEPLPVITPIFENGMADMNGIVFTRSSATDDLVARLMAGQIMATGNEESDDVMLHQLLHASPSIAELAEVYTAFGKIRFRHQEDPLKVYDNIQKYLDAVIEAGFYDLNFAPPPEEDIAMLTTFRHALKDMAEGIQVEQYGQTGFTSLLSLFRGSAAVAPKPSTRRNRAENTTATLKRATPVQEKPEDLLQPTVVKDPFAFLGGN